MTSNHQRMTEGFEILTGVLAPYVAGELRAQFGDEWWGRGVLEILREHQKQGLPPGGADDALLGHLDAARCLILMDVQWHDLFRRKLGREHRNWIKELINTRNGWAHRGLLDTADDDTWRALDTMTRMVEQMDSEATERLRVLARTVRYGTEGPSTPAGAVEDANVPAGAVGAGVLTEAPRAGLRPWREVARPHPDVAAGRYRQAEFAADLAQVARGTAESEYQDPVEFFARTYLTEGIRGLLLQALKRMSGAGGEPVIQLQTAFGGGKTHSLLALWHLCRGRAPLERLPGVAGLLQEAGVAHPPAATVAVVVGTALEPNRARRPPNRKGVTIRTLWGEIGAQLAAGAGNLKLYDHVRKADKNGVPPGSEALRGLLDACGPCLILIDELVAYARKIHGVAGLPAGSFDAVLTFIQELTEAVRASKRAVLVATIPESDIEIGGEAGQKTLERLAHTFGRMEAVWKPVGSEEGFEVVRRRLFLPIEDETARDDVCRAFSRLYRQEGDAFPGECREARYLERIKSCYPIHPEVFDRLYADWATLDRFQRTRGVLRLMAAVIHDLWARNDASPLILPGAIGLDAPAVRDELTRHLPEGWTPVLESDVDGPNSVPARIDAEQPRFGQQLAARRVARSIFLGSAPHVAEQQVRGVSDARVRLGAAQPGETTVPVFNDALAQLAEGLTYLYRQDRRYWYDTRPNLRRTVEERAGQFADEEVDREIVRRVSAAVRGGRGDFGSVHACPGSTGDVPDEPEARLVVLRPEATHRRNDAESRALGAADEVLANRGTAPRQHRNALLFLAADSEAMESLRGEVRRFLAWQSVVREQDALNLDTYQRREASEGERASEGSVGIRFGEAWCWLLVPQQPVENGVVGALEWDVIRTDGAGEPILLRASRQVRAAEHLIVQWSPALLRMELDNWFWEGCGHVSIREVWDALTSYPYLPRLRDRAVLEAAIREGAAGGEYFGYATSVSESGRYEGLRFGADVAAIHVDAASALVKPDRAQAQMAAEQTEADGQGWPDAEASVSGGDESGRPDPDSNPPPPQVKLPRRFFGTVEIDPDRASRDMGRVAEEVLQHLTTLPGGRVRVTVEIEAEVAEGVSEEVQRIVDENSRTLRFTAHGFETS